MGFGLKDQIVEDIISVFSEFPEITEVVIYGSRAKGNSKPGSDIDLTLKGEALTLKELNKIGIALEDLLLPHTFDLSIYQHIDNPDLIEHIGRVGKVLYSVSSNQRIAKKLLQ